MSSKAFDLAPFEPNWQNAFYHDGLEDWCPMFTDIFVNPPFSMAKLFCDRCEKLR